ncbi:MAG: hypothetical protein RIR67_1258, partial [Bacteroidota bacterium]
LESKLKGLKPELKKAIISSKVE